MNKGYIEVIKPEHPNARKNGSVLEHRLVAERKLGRYLKKTEVVHHIDENKTNNDEDNLIVFRTNADHVRFHKIGTMKDMGDGTYTCPILEKNIVQCKHCGKYFIKNKDKKHNKYCSIECYKEYRSEQFKLNRPNKELLQDLVKQFPFTDIGKMYGVTDNSVRKWCKKYGIPYKYRDIHPKKENDKNKSFLLDNYKIRMLSDKNIVTYNNICEAVKFIKNNYANNTIERNIRTSIANAIKNKKKYFGYNWELLQKDIVI